MKTIRTCLSAVLIALLSACGGGSSVEETPSLATLVQPSNPAVAGQFGYATALSQDGSTMAVAARREGGGGSGINGDQGPGAENSGAVYVFVLKGGAWVQQAYIKASNAAAGDEFGYSIALSADGNTLAVGAPMEDGASSGVNRSQADGISDSGAVYVFARGGDAWREEAYIKASNTGEVDLFGYAVALSGDGRTLAIGAPYEDSPAITVNGDQGDDPTTFGSGATYVFTRDAVSWTQQAYLKGSRSGSADVVGSAVALSFDGNTLAVGSWEDGVEGLQRSGAAYIFTRAAGIWSEQALLRADAPEEDAFFGNKLALSADGNILAVGSGEESGNASGINGQRAATPLPKSGAAYVFMRNGTDWTQQAYIKASNPGEKDLFGTSVAISADGNTLAVGAFWEDSTATGLNGNQSDNTGVDVGAAYVFRRNGSTWSQTTYVKPIKFPLPQWFGDSVALSGDGQRLVVGARRDSTAGSNDRAVHVYPAMEE